MLVVGPSIVALRRGLAPGVVVAVARGGRSADVHVAPLHAQSEVHKCHRLRGGRRGGLVFHTTNSGSRASLYDVGLFRPIALDVEGAGLLGVARIHVSRPVVSRGALSNVLSIGTITTIWQEDALATRAGDAIARHTVDRGGLERTLGDEFVPLGLGGHADVRLPVVLPHTPVIVRRVVIGHCDVAANILHRCRSTVRILVVGPGEGVLGAGLAPCIVFSIFFGHCGMDVLVAPPHAQSEVHKLKLVCCARCLHVFHGSHGGSRAALDGCDTLRAALDVEGVGFLGVAAIHLRGPVVCRGALPHGLSVGGVS